MSPNNQLHHQHPSSEHPLLNKVYPFVAIPVNTVLINHSFTDKESGLTTRDYPLVTTDYYPHYSLLDSFDFDPKLTVDYNSTFSSNHFSVPRVAEERPLSLKNFFLLQRVDTPIVLHQRRSKFRPAFEDPTTALVTMLSSHGLQPRIRLWLLAISRSLYKGFFKTTEDANSLGDSYPLLAFLFYNSIEPADSFGVDSDDEVAPLALKGWDESSFFNWKYGHGVRDWEVEVVPVKSFDELLFLHLRKYIPIFAMKSKKVDKMRFKHSRGKSGKYTVEWKYVPRYRRLNIVLRWLVDDVRFQKAPTFKLQMLKSLKLLLTSPHDHLVGRNRAYVHKNVYIRYKNTLLRSLKKIH